MQAESAEIKGKSRPWEVSLIGWLGFVSGAFGIVGALYSWIPVLFSSNQRYGETAKMSLVFSLISLPIAIPLSIFWLITGWRLLQMRTNALERAIGLLKLGIVLAVLLMLIKAFVIFTGGTLRGYPYKHDLFYPGSQGFIYLWLQLISPVFGIVLSVSALRLLNRNEVKEAFGSTKTIDEPTKSSDEASSDTQETQTQT